MGKPERKKDNWSPDFLDNIKFERRIGYNQACDEWEKWILWRLSSCKATEEGLIDEKDKQSIRYGNSMLNQLIKEIKQSQKDLTP